MKRLLLAGAMLSIATVGAKAQDVPDIVAYDAGYAAGVALACRYHFLPKANEEVRRVEEQADRNERVHAKYYEGMRAFVNTHKEYGRAACEEAFLELINAFQMPRFGE